MKSLVIRWLPRFSALVLFLAGVESMARLDDCIHLGVPLLASPDNERDLKIRECWGFRGRPHGLYRKWKLNEFGFRGPEIPEQPADATTRILVLGASETLGLLESDKHEYPAQLQSALAKQGKFEVVNGAMTSLTAAAMQSYWEHWLRRFKPHFVLVYASPVFYLRDEPPVPLKVLAAAELPGNDRPFQLRLVDRATSLYRTFPASLRQIRRDIQLQRQVAKHDKSWFFAAVPEDRLTMYRRDVATLVGQIRQDGAIPILVTHAASATSPPRSEDLAHLHDMRAEFCRPTPEIIAQFEKLANQAIRDLAREQGIDLIDAAAALSGQRSLFGDLVHFNDQGAARLAELLAARIVPAPADAAVQTVGWAVPIRATGCGGHSPPYGNEAPNK